MINEYESDFILNMENLASEYDTTPMRKYLVKYAQLIVFAVWLLNMILFLDWEIHFSQ
jgi:hypothetical protein